MTPEQRADNANRLLNDDTLKMALDMIKSDCVGVFIYPNSSEEEIMEARRMVRTLDAFETKLKSLVTSGELAKRKHKDAAP